MKYRSLSTILIAISVCLIGAVKADLHATDHLWSGTCKATFHGTSTLHDFSGTVVAEPFTVTTSDLSEGPNAKANGQIQVKVAKMDTDNKKRDAKMHKSLDESTYPVITVSVKDLKASATKPIMSDVVPQPTVIPFSMSLMGKNHLMTAKVSDWSYAADAISCKITFPVSLAKVGIKPPSVLGLVKVADDIFVEAQLSLKKG
tara:strand:- start:218 stop:823 length:606 start_codon:yes stop_codon:yes gene_type:complete